jgi:hypothetical protein
MPKSAQTTYITEINPSQKKKDLYQEFVYLLIDK